MAALVLFGISGALAALTALTKLYEIRCRRTPDYIAATTFAHTARRHRDPDRSMRLTLVERALTRDPQLSHDHLTALLSDPRPVGDLPPPTS